MNRNPLTAHHLISASHWWHSYPENIRMLRENTHRALHCLLADRHPIQQLRYLLELNKSTLEPMVYFHLSDTLSMYERKPIEAYKRNLFNPDKFVRRENV